MIYRIQFLFCVPFELKQIPLKRTLLSILTGSLFLTSCSKVDLFDPREPEEICIPQFINPLGRSYACDSIAAYNYTKKHCGLLPLSTKSYWIYLDSIYTDGILSSVKRDTLRFKSYISLPDSLIWWEPDMDLGLPSILFANDSAIFTNTFRFFSQDCIKDVKKEYCLFDGETAQYLTSFDDNAAMGRSVKLSAAVACPAGNFDECILFEKNAPFFRKDVMIFKPGVGVVKYQTEKTPMGSSTMKLEKISTLLSYHIE
jgi:hypothetical protein